MSGTTAPKNTEGTPEGTPPETPAEEQGTESATEEQGAESGTEEQGTEQAPAAPAPAPDNQGGFVARVINGVSFSLPQAVSNHIAGLEKFRNETIDQSRRDYVTGLASSNKIPATQIDSLQKLVLSFSDEQYADWKASYDAAPSAPLFGQYGNTGGDSGRPSNGNGGESVEDEIAILEQIVADHRRAGMSQAQIESKESYKKLQALKSQQTTK